MSRLSIAALICLTLLAALASVAQEARSVPNLAGTWRLDRDLTTADLSRIKTEVLVIRQTYEEIRFDYYGRDKLLGQEKFETDGAERPRYKTRIERAYARATWKGNHLVIRTRSFLDVFGYQSYELTDMWERSEDGQTLINKSSDGKMMVYYRISALPTPP